MKDWDAAYANASAIAQSERWPAAWERAAGAFRAAAKCGVELDLGYGLGGRRRYDLFKPPAAIEGLVVFVHGGFWMKLDKSVWSHLGQGAVARGWAVAIPSYPLTPAARIAEITAAIAEAIAAAAARIAGPIRLIGHSAGGQLATRMISATSPLAPPLRARVAQVVSVSGLHDLTPLLRTALNRTLRLDEAECRVESPALLAPAPGARLSCWVGADELPEFRRQSRLMARRWAEQGAATRLIEAPGRHHFDVLDSLTEADGAMTEELLRA